MTKMDPDELLMKASDALGDGKHGRAAELCAKAIALRPSAPAYALLAQIADADERPRDAIAALEAAAAIEPGQRAIWSRLATLHMTAHAWPEAEAAAARAIALDPFDTSARAAAALAAAELGNGADAWRHWAVIELVGDTVVSDGLALSIESTIDPDYERDHDDDKARARAAAQAEFPTEGARRRLLAAVRRADLDEVKAALAAGAPPDARDDDERTALIMAAGDGELEIVRALLDAGADPNAFRLEVLMVAVLDTALERARHGGHKKIVKLLQERGAKETDELPDPQALYLEQHGTPHQRLVEALWGDDPARVERALAAGADPNGRAHDPDERVLEAAVRLRKPEYVRLLLAAGADPNTRTSSGEPLLFNWIFDDESLACAIALLEGGADPNVRHAKKTIVDNLPGDDALRDRLAQALVAHGLDQRLAAALSRRS